MDSAVAVFLVLLTVGSAFAGWKISGLHKGFGKAARFTMTVLYAAIICVV